MKETSCMSRNEGRRLMVESRLTETSSFELVISLRAFKKAGSAEQLQPSSACRAVICRVFACRT